MTILLLLTLSACVQPRKFCYVPGFVADGAWEPGTNQVQQALSSAEQYCRMELSDTVRKIKRDQAEAQVETIVSNDTITISFDPPQLGTNSIPQDFKVYGVPYLEYENNIGPFIEDNAGGRIRFIAVQHLLSQETIRKVKGARPFTVYYNIENGKTGLNTVSTWDKEENDGFDRVEIIYSPGPPYYIGAGRF